MESTDQVPNQVVATPSFVQYLPHRVSLEAIRLEGPDVVPKAFILPSGRCRITQDGSNVSGCFLARQGLVGLLEGLGKGSRDQVSCKWVAAGRIDDPAQREWYQDRQGLVAGAGGVPDVLEEKASDGATKSGSTCGSRMARTRSGPVSSLQFARSDGLSPLCPVPRATCLLSVLTSHYYVSPLQVKAVGDPLDPPCGANVSRWSMQWRVLGHERERGTPSVK